jgi:transcriptional regulator of aromatic amino acid metabolism
VVVQLGFESFAGRCSRCMECVAHDAHSLCPEQGSLLIHGDSQHVKELVVAAAQRLTALDDNRFS